MANLNCYLLNCFIENFINFKYFVNFNLSNLLISQTFNYQMNLIVFIINLNFLIIFYHLCMHYYKELLNLYIKPSMN